MCRKLLLLTTILLVLGGTTQAALYLWNGGAGDGLWETPGNWTVTDSAWTWPNEEAVADPDVSDKYTNSDAIHTGANSPYANINPTDLDATADTIAATYTLTVGLFSDIIT